MASKVRNVRPELPAEGRTVPRPFLKWAGGKTQLLSKIWPYVPKKFGRYFEPFLGGGAVFFALLARNAVLSDVNQELVDCYVAIRDDFKGVVACLKPLKYLEATYYKIREKRPAELDLAERAARTIFLNRTGFNGLFRVNSSGGFNVPFGRHKNPIICDERNLKACSLALQTATLVVRDFEAVLHDAEAGDFVYLDPPYAPISKTSFTAYAAAGFGWDQQRRLAKTCTALAARGCTVVLSNSDTPEVRSLYVGLSMASVPASRRINSVASGRGPVRELLVYSGSAASPEDAGQNVLSH